MCRTEQTEGGFMKSIFQTKIPKVLNCIASKKNSLKNHRFASFLLGLTSVLVVFLMTGMVYFRYEAFINDNGEEYRVFTMFDELEEILEEQNITVGEHDRVFFDGVKDNEAHITIYRAVTVAVVPENEAPVYVECAFDETVADAIERSGVTVGENDFVLPELTETCQKVREVKILRAYDAYIVVDGKVLTLQTAGQTAGQLLERAGIELKEDDYIDCEFDTPVTEEMIITVTRVRYAENKTIEIIPYRTIYNKSNLVSMYETSVTVEGENGARESTSRVKYVNGVRVSETPVSTTVTKEPVDKVISQGTALATPYSKLDSENLRLVNGIPAEYEYVISGKSTAYTSPPGCGTYSGRPLIIGSVAVDPDVIPFGSELYIVSRDSGHVYGYAIASDTGDLTAHGVLVDLYMGLTADAYGTACAYGAHQVDIYVLKEGANDVFW